MEKLQKGDIPSTVFKNFGEFDRSLLNVSADAFELASAVGKTTQGKMYISKGYKSIGLRHQADTFVITGGRVTRKN